MKGLHILGYGIKDFETMESFVNVFKSMNRPGTEISNKAYRKFVAEIKGNINGDNYVTSFRWIN